MRKLFQGSLRIGLSRSDVTLMNTSGWLRSRITPLAHAAISEATADAPDRLSAQLHEILAGANCANRSVTIILADEWIRLLMVTPPRNAGRMQDCRAAAAMRFQALYDEPAADWRIDGDWHARQPFLACAIPRALLAALHDLARRHHLRLIGIKPQFIAGWNCRRPAMQAGTWFGVAHGKLLTLGAINERRLCAVRATTVPSEAWHDDRWLPEHLSRESLRLNLPAPDQLHLYGDFPGQWTSKTFGTLRCTRLQARLPVPYNAGAALARSGMRS
jgi:hypothetical protein